MMTIDTSSELLVRVEAFEVLFFSSFVLPV